MREFGIEPGLEHYTCIVGLLSRAGRLEDAENFMQSIPIKWDIVTWRTLLNACYVHQNYRLGKRVAEIVLRLTLKTWERVSFYQICMPGQREIRNDACVFVSDDNEHPEAGLIHEKVELLAKIKPLDYILAIACELHDVEEEQKKDYLSYHSEKLAIAYALMKTPPEAPIRIINNLRMCDDCHSAVKFVSKVTNRMMIVRDVNHFHSFRDGCCSFADYW
ncbi:unnamed protein product [Fraxinus pennsylvanica]|uniref:DYW domain-containing protein n=1 Tax=Fraxinus pennsylvanica TaxID=56036 RepID=A0AAD2DLS0_9LAMI|nr:unnamed protein product [Fraxinus pennsylvanica]